MRVSKGVDILLYRDNKGYKATENGLFVEHAMNPGLRITPLRLGYARMNCSAACLVERY